MLPLRIWEANLSSYVAKIKNAAILIKVLPLTECWAKMRRLFMTRPNSYKPRRQRVYNRIDVVTTRRNVVVNPSYLIQNSQTTRALSYRCRDYSKKCRIKPVISRHCSVLCHRSRKGPVITRTISPRSTGRPEHARTYDNRRNEYENCTTIYG